VIEFFEQTLFTAISSFGTVALIIFVLVKEYRSNASSIEQKVSDGYKQRTEQLEQEVVRMRADFNAKFTEQTREIAKLSGVLEEKEKHINTLTKLIQGRNPEIMEILKKIEKSLATNQTETTDILNSQTEMLENKNK
jgi:hypothetical protein